MLSKEDTDQLRAQIEKSEKSLLIRGINRTQDGLEIVRQLGAVGMVEGECKFLDGGGAAPLFLVRFQNNDQRNSFLYFFSVISNIFSKCTCKKTIL